jgi:hypothetical protein
MGFRLLENIFNAALSRKGVYLERAHERNAIEGAIDGATRSYYLSQTKPPTPKGRMPC